MRRVLLIAALLSISMTAIARDPAQAAAFRRHNPCPATGKIQLWCKGYVVDHVIPLCAGGKDLPSNMQWQGYDASLVKDAAEKRQCAALRRAKKLAATPH